MAIRGLLAAGVLAAVLLVSRPVLAGTYSGGDGSAGAPYQIADLDDWRELRDTPTDWGGHFILTADIDLGKETGSTAVIAPDTDPADGFQGTAFTGHFDGNGKSIHHLTLDTLADTDSSNDSNGYLGLFGKCHRAVIQRLSLKNGLIRSGHSVYVGGLCGQNEGGQLVRCGFEGRVESGDFSACVGGLVGESAWLWYLDANFNDVIVAAEIDRCYTRGFVTGGINVGGLAGQSGVSQAVMSYADAIVSGVQNVGGFIGQHYGHVAIANCYATGSVNGQTDTGGFIGRNWAVDSDEGIVNCYAAAAVQGGPGTGGFIGSADHDHITHHCFWDIQAAGQTESAGGEGKLTSDMQTASTFISAGWDFAAPVWRVCGQAAPTLAWNHPDLNNSGSVDWADFVTLADHWQDTECGFCGNADLTGDRNVTLDDLLVFASAWMTSDSIAHHVYRIEIETSWDYEITDDPADDEYVFELNVMTDARVAGAAFTTPAGNTFTIPNMPVSEGVELSKGYYEIGREYDAEDGVYEWTYAFDFYSADSLSAYGDGLYTITVTYEGGREEQTTAWFGIPGTNDPIPQPTQMPVFTGFSNGETVSSPVTFFWEACTDPAAQHLWLEYESYALAVDEAYWLPISATELGAPVDMPAGEYEVSLGFETWHETSNSDGILVSVGKYSESVYDIHVVNETVSDHVFEIGITAERDYGSPEDASDDDYAIEIEVSTDDTVERIEFTTPAGNTFEIPNTPITDYAIDGGYLELGREFDDESGQYVWIHCPGFISPDSLSAYGDGLYTFTIYFAGGHSRQTTAWFGVPGTADPIPQPTQTPVITSFAPGAAVTSPVTFSWEAYSGSAAQAVWLCVYSGDDELEWTLPISATGLDEPLALPSGPHEAELEFEVYYESINADGILIDAGKYSESDYAFYVEQEVVLPDITWLSITDPGVSGHGGFSGEMSKTETTNAHYAQYLNAALSSGDITVSGSFVLGISGPDSGQPYYQLDGPGDTTDGAGSGGQSRIHYSGGHFSVESGFGNHPVTYVSWYGATAFAHYYGWRLPTEWEWQAVADYNGSYTYGCGALIHNGIANYYNSIHPDGTTPAGAFGVYGYGMADMAGNVWEWTSTVSGSYRISRGGSWYDSALCSAVSFRVSRYPYDTYLDRGFRVCR